MEIRIGISDTAQNLAVTLAEGVDRTALKTAVGEALDGKTSVLWLTDDAGREIAVATSRITHVEIGPSGSHPIGFG